MLDGRNKYIQNQKKNHINGLKKNAAASHQQQWQQQQLRCDSCCCYIGWKLIPICMYGYTQYMYVWQNITIMNDNRKEYMNVSPNLILSMGDNNFRFFLWRKKKNGFVLVYWIDICYNIYNPLDWTVGVLVYTFEYNSNKWDKTLFFRFDTGAHHN